MAATKWDDPDIDWDEEELSCPIHEAWQAIKEASDERNALYNATHRAGFDDDYTWPDFNNWALWFENTGNPNWAIVIQRAMMYIDRGFDFSTIDPTSIQSSGAYVPVTSLFTVSTAIEILTDAGWATIGGTNFRHMIETSDGVNTAPITRQWLKQWYQILSYNVYLRSNVTNSATYPYVTDVEEIDIFITVSAEWISGVWDSNVALLTDFGVSPTPVDVYVSGDLPESGTPPTNQDVVDYVQGLFDGYFATGAASKWFTPAGVPEEPLSEQVNNLNEITGVGTEVIACSIQYRTSRFKRVQGYRATDTERFDMDYLWNGRYTSDDTGDDQGTNEVNNEMRFRELIEDTGTDWNYFGIMANKGALPHTPPDFSTPMSNSKITMSTINANGTDQRSIIIQPNLTDGTGFEYYTPA